MAEKKLSQLLLDTLDATATKQEVADLFGALNEALKTYRGNLDTSVSKNRDEMAGQVQEVLSSLADLEARIREDIGKTDTGSKTGLEGLRSELKAQIEAVQDLIPELPDLPDFQAMLDQLHIPSVEDIEKDLPRLGEPIRDALELLPKGEKLIIEAIEGLREELDKLKKTNLGGGGTMGLSVGHWAQHEAFTMDGIATTVTLTNGGVGAQGNAVIVRYQGQTLDMTSQYTVSGNKITLVGFTPDSGTIISVTYWS